jgi:hypothetical protein
LLVDGPSVVFEERQSDIERLRASQNEVEELCGNSIEKGYEGPGVQVVEGDGSEIRTRM